MNQKLVKLPFQSLISQDTTAFKNWKVSTPVKEEIITTIYDEAYSGTIMSIYEKEDTLKQKGINLYGSIRLEFYNMDVDVQHVVQLCRKPVHLPKEISFLSWLITLGM